MKAPSGMHLFRILNHATDDLDYQTYLCLDHSDIALNDHK